MHKERPSILVFGVGSLQKSIIIRAQEAGLFVVGIDPVADAFCRNDVDAFEIVGGQDFEGTCAVVEKYGINAIITAATDKPLVMMARIAEKYDFPFFSIETAKWSTDKSLMKQRFAEGGIRCAKSCLIRSINELTDIQYPVIVKPRDNSGSRGVKLCTNEEELDSSIKEALQVSHLNSVLVEEFIEGPEYSIESMHHEGKTEVIQFTEKTTTPFPYNVELGHKQPALLTDDQKEEIEDIICKVANCMGFTNCPSHTELKINERGIFIIETSPRLGGDYITSVLTPLSTGINMEKQLLKIALGKKLAEDSCHHVQASGVCFLSLPQGTIKAIDSSINTVKSWSGIYDFEFSLQEGDIINPITSSLNRYGHFIASAKDRNSLDRLMKDYSEKISKMITI